MSHVHDLAGRLRLVPGAPLPYSLHNSRQDWASRIGVGQRADKLPGLMASLFSLCGQSHRQCSRLAVAAAQGQELPREVPPMLELETATEHVRRIGLDWPRWLTPNLTASDQDLTCVEQARASLQQCPILMRSAHGAPPADRWQGMTAWLENCCFHMPAQDWLTAWDREGLHWLRRWSQGHTGWLPRLIQSALMVEMALPMAADNALMPHADESQLRAWAPTWVHADAFVSQPTWRGACAHTGTWTRSHHAPVTCTTGTLLGCRLAELARLCLSAVSAETVRPILSYGALNLGVNHGIAWVEMARGLLIHQVVLEGAQENAVARIYRVVAPTEWNFHPQGVVASVVAGLSRHNDEALEQRIGVLMAAFDPCVPFEMGELPQSLEKENQGA